MILLKRIVKALSSLGLGVTLLFLLALILAFATKFESSTSTHLVQAYVYKTFWFDLLMALFGLNLTLATWNLRPWKLRHMGVITIHASILIILVGAWITRHYGFEGTMTLDEGQTADFIVMRDMVLTVYDPANPDTPLQSFPTSLADSPPQEFMNKVYELPGGSFTMDRFYTDAEDTMVVKEDGPEENPGLHAVFSSNMFKEQIWLFPRRQGEDRQDFNGLLRFESVEYPDQAAWLASLTTGGSGKMSFNLAGSRREVELPAAGQSVEVGGGFTLHMVRVYRNFSMNEQGAYADTPGPAANPALEFHLHKGEQEDHYVFFQQMPDYYKNMLENPALPMAEGITWEPRFSDGDLGEKMVRFGLVGPQVRVAWLQEGKLVEQEAQVGGAPLTLPWMGFQLAVDQVLKKAWRHQEMKSVGVDGNMPAARLRFEQNGVVEQKWLRLNQRKPVQLGGRTLLVGLEQRRVPLGFNLTLRDFVEDRYPGTAMAAGYASFVVLDDPQQGVAGKEIEISMNNTLVHRGFKFFQSSFSRAPQMGGMMGGAPMETTILSVNNDPGHLVVYVGSIFLVLGLLIVFTMKKKLIDIERRRAARAA